MSEFQQSDKRQRYTTPPHGCGDRERGSLCHMDLDGSCPLSTCTYYKAPPSSRATTPAGIGLVKMIQGQRDELYDAAVALLAHYGTTGNEEHFDRDLAKLMEATAKVPSYQQRLDNIFKAIAEESAATDGGTEK